MTVEPRSPAARAGFERGDVILGIDMERLGYEDNYDEQKESFLTDLETLENDAAHVEVYRPLVSPSFISLFFGAGRGQALPMMEPVTHTRTILGQASPPAADESISKPLEPSEDIDDRSTVSSEETRSGGKDEEFDNADTQDDGLNEPKDEMKDEADKKAAADEEPEEDAYGANPYEFGDDDDADDADDDGGFGKIDEEETFRKKGSGAVGSKYEDDAAGDDDDDATGKEEEEGELDEGELDEASRFEDDDHAGQDRDEQSNNYKDDDDTEQEEQSNSYEDDDDDEPSRDFEREQEERQEARQEEEERQEEETRGGHSGGFNFGKVGRPDDDKPNQFGDDDAPGRISNDDDNAREKKPKVHDSGEQKMEQDRGLWGSSGQQSEAGDSRSVPHIQDVESETGGYSYTLLLFVAVLVVVAIVFHKKIRASMAGGNAAGNGRRRRYDRRAGHTGP